MKYRPLGRTGMFVSEICLGTMTFGGQGALWSQIGQLDQPQVNKLVERSLAAGVNFFATAVVYSGGPSLRLVSQSPCELTAPRSLMFLDNTGPGPTYSVP